MTKGSPGEETGYTAFPSHRVKGPVGKSPDEGKARGHQSLSYKNLQKSKESKETKLMPRVVSHQNPRH